MTTVHKLYRPASVVLPDKTIHHRAIVYVTDEGVKVFTKPADEPEWSAAVDFAKVREPRRSQLHVGIDIETEAGLVVITPTGGCESCGSRFRGWQPSWATRVQKWPTPPES